MTACAALTVSGCTPDGDSGAQPSPPDATVSQATPTPSSTALVAPQVPPARDACYRLTPDQLTRPTDDSDPVACARQHTSQTIHVGRLRLLLAGRPRAVDSRRVQAQVAAQCPRHLVRYVGGTEEDRALSRLRVVWFTPTLQEAHAGARWYRCDLVAFGRGETLHRQAGRVPVRVLDGEPGRDRYGLCGTAQPGSESFQRTLCGLPHSWRAIATIAIAGGPAYPGAEAVRRDGDEACQDAVREREGFALTFTYGWEWPTREQWRAGQRFGYCWAEDER